jgi:hypothetical protein
LLLAGLAALGFALKQRRDDFFRFTVALLARLLRRAEDLRGAERESEGPRPRARERRDRARLPVDRARSAPRPAHGLLRQGHRARQRVRARRSARARARGLWWSRRGHRSRRGVSEAITSASTRSTRVVRIAHERFTYLRDSAGERGDRRRATAVWRSRPSPIRRSICSCSTRSTATHRRSIC